MTKSAAERAKAYRERLKEKGGKQLRITLAPGEAKYIESIAKFSYPDLELDCAIREMVVMACKRSFYINHEAIRLRDTFGADKWIVAEYIDYMDRKLEAGSRFTAEEFMEYLHEKNNALECEAIRNEERLKRKAIKELSAAQSN